LPTSHQTIGTFSIGYTYVGHTRFGAVDWRPARKKNDIGCVSRQLGGTQYRVV
jgi:hypothetical protein